MLFINEQTVLKFLNWNETFKAIEIALKSASKVAETSQNGRQVTSFLDSAHSILMTMPGNLKNNKYGGIACKLVTANPNNPKLAPPLPVIQANIALFDNETGALKAIVAGTEITKWRTAAASAVATKHLTRGKKQEVLAILGAGVQGKIHAEAFSHFFDFKEIRVWNHNAEKAAILVDELNASRSDGIFKFFQEAEECVQGADVIVTATLASSPILQREWIGHEVHINAVGAGITHHSELAPSIYLAGDVYVDYMEGARIELAGLQDLGVHFKDKIGNVISQPTFTSPDKITVFQSLGMAVEDCAMARLIYDKLKMLRKYIRKYPDRNVCTQERIDVAKKLIKEGKSKRAAAYMSIIFLYMFIICL